MLSTGAQHRADVARAPAPDRNRRFVVACVHAHARAASWAGARRAAEIGHVKMRCARAHGRADARSRVHVFAWARLRMLAWAGATAAACLQLS